MAFMTPRPLAFALVLAVSASVASVSAGNAAAADTAVMDAWKAYALSSVTPRFSWAVSDQAVVPTLRPSVVNDVAASSAAMEFALPLGMRVRLGEQNASREIAATALSSLNAQHTGFAQVSYASTLSTRLPGDVGLGLSAVVSQQRFLTPGMGESFWQADSRLIGAAFGPEGQVVSGFGMRADLKVPVSEASRWVVSMQSRVDMDTFKSYRGVYSESGDFDTPAHAGLRFAQDIGQATFSLGFDRIFYSDISAVTSYGLPNRLLSLLGDGNSPEFAWRDHTVYSFGMEYATSPNGGLSLRYSTRLQPSPTSILLRRAMQSDFSNRNFALGYRHALGRLGSILFSASHSGASYFVGSAPLRQSDFDKGSINEFEVLWALPF